MKSKWHVLYPTASRLLKEKVFTTNPNENAAIVTLQIPKRENEFAFHCDYGSLFETTHHSLLLLSLVLW